MARWRYRYDAVPTADVVVERSLHRWGAAGVTCAVRLLSCVLCVLLLLLCALTAADVHLRRQAAREPFPLPLRAGLPVLSRNVYLITCSDQACMHAYAALFATISVWADVVVYCWRKDCSLPAILLSSSSTSPSSASQTVDSGGQLRGSSYISPESLLVSPWPTLSHRAVQLRNGDVRAIDRFSTPLLFEASTAPPTVPSAPLRPSSSLLSPALHFYPVHGRFEFLNERRLHQRLTWTGSRNYLLTHTRRLETEQGWQWAYLTFLDGDVHPTCETLRRRLYEGSDGRSVNASRQETYLMQLNRALSLRPAALHSLLGSIRTYDRTAPPTNMSQVARDQATFDETVCWLTYDSFLLTAAPAMASITNSVSAPVGLDDVAEVSYHLDAMVASIHVDARVILLPYCERFDSQSWWTSQAYIVTRAVCVLGHTLQFNQLHMAEADHSHTAYPKSGSPWAMVAPLIPHIVPADLQHYSRRLADQRHVSILPLTHYAGFTLDAAHSDCRHSSIDPRTCMLLPPLSSHAAHSSGTYKVKSTSL